MKLQTINNNPSFGTSLRISSNGMATIRNYESQKHGFNKYLMKKHMERLSNNGKQDTLIIDSNADTTKLMFFLIDWRNKIYSDVQYDLNTIGEGTKLSLYKIYKNLDKQIKKLQKRKV